MVNIYMGYLVLLLDCRYTEDVRVGKLNFTFISFVINFLKYPIKIIYDLFCYINSSFVI
jgi:hypothetical protein